MTGVSMRTTAWAWVAALYIASVLATAVALRFLGKPHWFGPMYWTSIATLFLIECYLLHRRLGAVRHLGIRYTAVILASAVLTLVTAYVGITIVFSVFGPFGW